MTHTVGIYLFDEVEVLDFAGPFEVFSTASRVKARLQPDIPPLFEVFTVDESIRPISARGGLLAHPHFDLTNHPAIDVLVVPGGVVMSELARKPVTDWITRMGATARITASVCTGAFLLGKVGLLHGKPATTHWEDIPELRAMFPDIQVQQTRAGAEPAAVSSWIDLTSPSGSGKLLRIPAWEGHASIRVSNCP